LGLRLGPVEIVERMSSPDIAVFYLARGIGGGLSAAAAFFESYQQHPAGLPHRLVVITKGWDGMAGLDRVQSWTKRLGGSVLMVKDDGFDLGAYSTATELITSGYCCFFNTHSQILENDWLLNMSSAVSRPDVGIVGATGSYGSIATPPRLQIAMLRQRQSALGLPAFLLRLLYLALVRVPKFYLLETRQWPGFPNPHVRTNAFMLRHSDFRAFLGKHAFPGKKQDVWSMESGNHGLTRFFQKQGLGALVVGRNGVGYEPEHWPESGVFRSPQQPNLMVADNQTRGYERADPAMQRLLELTAWGKIVSPDTTNP
jgi:hypothetical protein